MIDIHMGSRIYFLLKIQFFVYYFVQYPVPSSIQSIPDKVVTEGNNVILTCNASGFPEPVVSWINVPSGNRTHGNVLKFENVSRHKAGEYRCEARNPCWNATESATIDVQCK